ncbi:acetolactate synthase [Bordetella pseudohinzii]|uniref:Acetolactate synthase n=3 Tax=Bordetella pseudohinzii TaxID=1331258 RepID=A0A0J6C7U5_9BORD|nr:thiamine pyrophosphate-binding protein [Bordetella pseudohinzii]ANY16830.1 acetolactate synthase [Bordetella pseudohinzii]KMM25412.1 acetolactate synthase [Bordetella pseudohinzii]KXA77293.1 acetolactate synthase [Bordetella pseudohinzii]KXA78907.1 acetolactate synthase [Bordetella pseudohinzii]CUI92108.1 Benzoylformate decarboxylase [Bordetella pseudohinzii]
MTALSNAAVRRDIPQPSSPDSTIWCSDAIADILRGLDIPYVLLNPGASFRGLHDSIVNHLGNERPQMIVVLHEEHAVAIAHGYAKVHGKPLAAILHSNVGLMHGSMAIFDAWVDRVPVLVFGATGPVDAAKRRPWIDWIHTAQDQAALVRHFIKWDAQPASIGAAQEAILRARQIASTAPQGPVYVCFDAALQESRLAQQPARLDPSRYLPPPPARPSDEVIAQAAALLSGARRPVILAGRVSRDERGWQQRIQLAETLNAEVLTDLKVGCAFPTDHRLHAAPAGHFLSARAREVLRDADVVLSLDWLDLAGTLKQAWEDEAIASKIIQVSVDHYSHNGWSMDHQGLPPVDVFLLSEPEAAVELLNPRVRARAARPPARAPQAAANGLAQETLTVATVAAALRHAIGGQKTCLMRLPLSWSGEMWDFRHPLDFLGYDGGGGIGSGPGMAIGSALALKGSDRLPVAVIGDGDYLMGVNALWTAANAGIPLLMIVCNNRSFFNDEVHQERMARQRNRPVENRWIGQRIANPEPDLAAMARAQGLTGIGPIDSLDELSRALPAAIDAVKNGQAIVLDVIVQTGYSPAMTAGLTRSDS